MSIQIITDHQSLHVTGDIQTVLTVPSGAPHYWVSLSDGTLLEGHQSGSEHSFRVATEGAGLTRIDGAKIEHDWRVEWAAVSPFEAAALAEHTPGPLPLFEGLRDLTDDELPY